MNYVIDGKDLLDNASSVAIVVPGLLGYAEEEHLTSLGKDLVGIGIPTVRFTPQTMVPDKEGFLNDYNQASVYEELVSTIEDLSLRVEDLILLGFSAGGPIVFKYAAKYRIKAVVAIASPYQVGDGDDLKMMTQWKDRGYLVFKSSKLGKVKVPYSYYRYAKGFNIKDYGGNVECPVLFIVGEDDVNVPKESSRVAYDVCNEPKKFIVVKGMDHKYKKSEEITKEVNSQVIESLKEV